MSACFEIFTMYLWKERFPWAGPSGLPLAQVKHIWAPGTNAGWAVAGGDDAMHSKWAFSFINQAIYSPVEGKLYCGVWTCSPKHVHPNMYTTTGEVWGLLWITISLCSFKAALHVILYDQQVGAYIQIPCNTGRLELRGQYSLSKWENQPDKYSIYMIYKH